MKNYQQRGHVIEIPAAAAAVAAGQPVAIGAILAVANGPAAVGEPYNAERVGVFVLPKAAGVAWAQGQPLRWDVETGAFVAGGGAATAGDVTGAAFAFEAADSAAAQGAVCLPGVIGTVAA